MSSPSTRRDASTTDRSLLPIGKSASSTRTPHALLRGLIHSDGWRGINRVRHAARTYEYVRYQFTNASPDIRSIFCATCDALGIEWRRMGERDISIARRASVARLDAFVGPKR
ncbi:MAG TPA: hypothetical protein VFZ89_13670 [Solirubrobacteraceae bacterium]